MNSGDIYKELLRLLLAPNKTPEQYDDLLLCIDTLEDHAVRAPGAVRGWRLLREKVEQSRKTH